MAVYTNFWVERHMFDAGGHTSTIYYVRFVRRGDSKIWNPTTKLLKDVGDITWDDSTTELVEQGSTGVFPITITHDWRTPEDIALEEYSKQLRDLTDEQKAAVGALHQAISNLPAGTYDIIVYEQSSSIPANTDDVVKQYETKLGRIFVF